MSLLLRNAWTLILLGVSAFSVVQAQDEVICINAVSHASNLQKMSSGDFSANAYWKAFNLTPNSIGYGPAADRQYEITVIDGRVILARPGEGDNILIRNDPHPDEGVAMLQLASPKRWGEFSTLSAIGTFDDLGFEMDQQVEDAGCGDDALLPFKITGHAQRITWSMDTEPSRVVQSEQQPVELVGLYNRNARKTYFMVPGYNLHVHAYLPDSGQGGHVRDLQLDEGAILHLPLQ